MRVDDELKTYLEVLWRYKWMIIICTVLTTAIAGGISLILTPKYTATTTVRVASASVASSDYAYYSAATRLSNTYVDIATSDKSLYEVANRVGLIKKPKVEVEIVPETELIEIKATDSDPARARDIASVLANIMIEQSVEFYGGSAPTATKILDEQLQQAKIDLDTAISNYDTAIRLQATPVAPTNGTPEVNLDTDTLQKLVSVRQQIYADLLQQYESARTSEQLRANAISIVEPASLPLKPSSPIIPLNAALGMAGGLVVGVILAFIFEGMDSTVRNIEDIQAVTQLPILCTVPEERRVGSNGSLIDASNGQFIRTTSIDKLSARLLLLEQTIKPTAILISSPEPGSGKSTIAANLAVSLVQNGNRVILMDMDFYHPRQHLIFGLSESIGLSNISRGELKLESAIQSTSINPQLRVITAGSSLGDSSAWLIPAKIHGLLESLKRLCDFVIIDAPALLTVADPTVFSSQVNSVILVVRKRKTERENLRLTIQQLHDLNVTTLGIVVNRVANSHLYSYYYYDRKGKPSHRQQVKVSKTLAVAPKDQIFTDKNN